MSPGEFSLEEVENEVEEALHIVSSGGHDALVVVDAGELHIVVFYFCVLVGGLGVVFGGVAVLIATGPAEVDEEELPVLLPLPQHHVARVQVVVDEVLEVEVLVDVEQLQGH